MIINLICFKIKFWFRSGHLMASASRDRSVRLWVPNLKGRNVLFVRNFHQVREWEYSTEFIPSRSCHRTVLYRKWLYLKNYSKNDIKKCYFYRIPWLFLWLDFGVIGIIFVLGSYLTYFLTLYLLSFIFLRDILISMLTPQPVLRIHLILMPDPGSAFQKNGSGSRSLIKKNFILVQISFHT